MGGGTPMSQDITWHDGAIGRSDRPWLGSTVWLTGLSGSGKSTIAVALEQRLVLAGRPAFRLDGDNLRLGLNSDLGFTPQDRDENVRRAGEVACLLAEAGVIAIVPLISPYRAARERARSVHDERGIPFIEVFVDTPIEVCEARDPKGLYARARAGELTGFTGVDDPYEPPLEPDLILVPEDGDATEQAGTILNLVT